jgi:hypothetical protein
MEVSSQISVSFNFANDSNLHLGLCVMNVALYVTTPKDQSQGVLVQLVFLPMTVSKNFAFETFPRYKD